MHHERMVVSRGAWGFYGVVEETVEIGNGLMRGIRYEMMRKNDIQ